MKKLSVFLVLLVHPVMGQQHQPAIDRLIDSLRTANHIPAMVAAVVTPDVIQYGFGGIVRADSTEKVTPAQTFHLGSDTKAVTSFIAAKLVEQKKLSWDTKLTALRPDLTGKIKADYDQITLADLLAHRARIRPYTNGLEYTVLPPLTGSVSQQRRQFAGYVLNQDPVTPDSAGFAYSNAGYAIAALMLEAASKQSWEELVARTFGELKLTYYLGFPNHENRHEPWGHLADNNGHLQPLPPSHPYRLLPAVAPAGDLSMSIIDYARFIQLHLRGLTGMDNYLRTQSYQTLHFGRKGYAYGWGNGTLAHSTTRVSYHDGSAGTFYCHTYLIPAARKAIIVIANAANDPTQQAIYALRKQLLVETRTK